MKELWARFPEYLSAHLELSLAALAIAAAVAVPLGVWLGRRPRAAPALLALAGALQTIPSLALLAFMVPALAALGLVTSRLFGFEVRAIGYGPALAALTLYGVLPILQNTVAGLRGVDPACREAARGVGMTPRQQLWRVEIPLALPVMVAGLRTAAVWVVGTATLSTPVGAASLGNYIFSGLQTRNYAAVSLGCVSAAGLAFVLDRAIGLVERGVRERRRALTATAAGLLVALGVTAALANVRSAEAARPIVIGAKTFTEQYILSDLLADFLERDAGLPTRPLQSLGSTVLFDALRSGEVDVYVDYTGTLWANVLKGRGAPGTRAALLDEVRRRLQAEQGVTVAAALGFENTYALAMRADRARSLGIATLSDLAAHAPELEIGADYEFLARPEWQALVGTYGFAFRRASSMDPSLMYQAVADGQVDVISAFSTDGRLAALGLTALRDDRGVIPPYDAVVLVGPRLARERPDVVRKLGGLEGRIDAETMRELNRDVDQEGRTPAEVARAWLDTLR